jgi:hypothetical protein
LERQGADLQTKIEELQLINQSLRENDKVKEGVLPSLHLFEIFSYFLKVLLINYCPPRIVSEISVSLIIYLLLLMNYINQISFNDYFINGH